MATSGQFNANTVTYGCYMFIQWYLVNQEIANNRSQIAYTVYFHFQGSDTQLDNGAVWSNVGSHWSNGGRVYNYSGNLSTRDMALNSSSFWVNHGSDGNANLQFGIGITTQFSPTRSEGTSPVWSLPTIPREAKITNVVGNFNDEANPWVEFSNPAGFSVDTYLHIPDINGTAYAMRTGVTSRYTWSLTTPERDALRLAMAGVNSTRVQYVVRTLIGGVYYYSTTDRTLSIVNGNPVFSDFTYEDSNSTTTTITGDNQYIIQGYSTLNAKISTGQKALSIKEASMVKYNLAISSVSVDETYTTSAINKALGVLNVSSDTNLIIKAIDSRTNFTPVTKLVKILPYAPPLVVATARRVNNFETSTNFHIEGTFSRLTITGTDKNAVNTSTGVAYRYKKVTDASWGSWIDKTSSTSSGSVSVTDFAVNLDRNYAWQVEVRITDKLTTTTLPLIVPIGTPIFRVSTYDNLVYNNEQPLMPSHVGQILHSTTLTTAGAVQAIYGGTWVAWGVGRVLVGVDTGQAEFDTVEETGGAKTHTLTTAQIPSHNHSFATYFTGGGNGSRISAGAGAIVSGAGSNDSLVNTGGGGSHNNLQPYITAYMWKRTV